MNKESINRMVSAAFLRLKEMAGIELNLIDFNEDEENKFLSDVRLVFRANNKEYEVFTDIRSEIREKKQMYVRLLMKYFTKDRLIGVLLIANYIHPDVKLDLRAQGINYLETSGNCHIQMKDLFLYIEGQKAQAARVKTKNKAFNLTGLKVIITLLLNPTLLDSNYREIAKECNVALGGVGVILKDLESQGYIKSVKDKRVLYKKQELLDRWLDIYPYTLREKQLVGRYKGWGNQPARTSKEPYFISALDLNEKRNEATECAIYTSLPVKDLKAKLGLTKDKDGKVLVLRPFWNLENMSFVNGGYVNIILNYADRINHPD